MRIRSHATMHQIEVRKLSFLETEKFANILGVPGSGSLGRHFPADAMHLPVRDFRRADQTLLGQSVVAGGIGGRNATLIHPKKMHAIPAELGSHQISEEQSRRGAARDSEGSEFLSGKRFFQDVD